MNHRVATPVLIAALSGFALWWAAAVIGGRREAWDAVVYWAVAYPVAIGVCAALGHAYPQRPWRWAIVLFEAQFLALCVRNGALGSLWPMGVLIFAVIALPGVAAAQIASRWGRRS